MPQASQLSSTVRVVVLGAYADSPPEETYPPRPGSTPEPGASIRVPADPALVAGEAADAHVDGLTRRALERLGDPCEIFEARDAQDCLRVAAEPGVDLVLLDRCSPRLVSRLLEALRTSGPPCVVVTDSDDDGSALAAFRAGASDCIRFGPEFDQTLPMVVLEQVRRWRAHTQRRASERRIRWLEGLYEAIVSEIPASLVVVDSDLRVVGTNPEFSRTFDVSGAAARRGVLSDHLPAELATAAEAAIEAGARGEESQLIQVAGEPGRPRVFDLRTRRLDETGRQLLVLNEVTRIEYLARRVEDLERYNENIIQNINSALIVVDRAGRITFANSAAEQVLGAKEGALLGRHAGDWFEGESDERSPIARSLTHRERYRGAEGLVRRDDGKLVPVGISCAPLLASGGRQLGVVAIFEDLTEIKELQRQVLQTEKLASIGELAAGVAHEINNPMGFIHANLYQMSEYLDDLQRYWRAVDELRAAGTTGDVHAVDGAVKELDRVADEIDLDFVRRDFGKAVRESQEGSERIRHIVQDLRDFSRQDTAERTDADVNQCVDSTANIVWTMMKHSVVLEKDYRELPSVRGYPMQLKQVFMNLLMNAYHAIEDRADDSGEPGVIEIATRCRDDGVVVSIRDSGVGIPADHLQRIFDPFFTTKEVGAGTGLGLSTSYGIVQRHGGTIHVDSEPGMGTTFEVWLPCKPPPERAAGTAEPREGEAAGGGAE